MVIKTPILPKQSTVSAFGLEQPCIQDPLNASQWRFLHLDGHNLLQPEENLTWSQPKDY